MIKPQESLDHNAVYYRIYLTDEDIGEFISTCRQHFDEHDYDQTRSLQHRFAYEEECELYAEILTHAVPKVRRKVERWLGGYGDD